MFSFYFDKTSIKHILDNVKKCQHKSNYTILCSCNLPEYKLLVALAVSVFDTNGNLTMT